MNKERILEAIKAHEAKIASERDALRDLYHEAEVMRRIEEDSMSKDKRISELESINADLYEALELLVDTNDNGGWPSAAIVVARAALAKARGEQ